MPTSEQIPVPNTATSSTRLVQVNSHLPLVEVHNIVTHSVEEILWVRNDDQDRWIRLKDDFVIHSNLRTARDKNSYRARFCMIMSNPIRTERTRVDLFKRFYSKKVNENIVKLRNFSSFALWWFHTFSTRNGAWLTSH